MVTHGTQSPPLPESVATAFFRYSACIGRADNPGPMRTVRRPGSGAAVDGTSKGAAPLLRQSLPRGVGNRRTGCRGATGFEGPTAIQGWELEDPGRAGQRTGRLPLPELRSYGGDAGTATRRPSQDTCPAVRVGRGGKPSRQSDLGLPAVPQAYGRQDSGRTSTLPRRETSRPAAGPRIRRNIARERSSLRTGVHRPCRRVPDSRRGQRRTASIAVRTGPPPP